MAACQKHQTIETKDSEQSTSEKKTEQEETTEKEESAPAKDEQVTINYYGKPNEELELKIIESFESEYPNIKVNYIALTGGSNDKLQAIQTILQAQDDSMDLFAADATWPTIFTAAGWVVPYDEIPNALEGNIIDNYMTTENFMQNGQVYGIPFQANVGALFYRKDLLEKYNLSVPTTWDKLKEAANVIMAGEDNPNLVGYAAGWKQSEGLSCVVLEYMWPNGMDIVKDGKVDIDEEQMEKSIQFMVNLMDEGISPEKMPTYGSEHRALYKSGNLIFARDWVTSTTKHFLNPEGNEYYDKTGVAIMPGGHGTLGNWGLMISKYSNNKEAAATFAKYRASKESLLLQNDMIGALPTIESSYDDVGLEERLLGYKDEIFEVVKTSKSRPITPYWGEVSQIIQVQVHSAISGLITSEEAATSIKEEITRIID
ncbi:extracellular solute-binding protein [Vallitalea sp.]|uniref:extracellular solute-binding protein n=1 Tax=Vallitalea sp. TaxID=1882829 RepID=UPI0025E7FA83|nr:extracellular solute-binding protein [Vallitalea sp.]MCT4686694.1 extracellular solute-binding protein [Vallitalea sp.]